MGDSASADSLEERLIDFAVRVIKVADRMVCRAELMTTDRLAALTDEYQQLCRILNASVKTAKKK